MATYSNLPRPLCSDLPLGHQIFDCAQPALTVVLTPGDKDDAEDEPAFTPCDVSPAGAPPPVPKQAVSRRLHRPCIFIHSGPRQRWKLFGCGHGPDRQMLVACAHVSPCLEPRCRRARQGKVIESGAGAGGVGEQPQGRRDPPGRFQLRRRGCELCPERQGWREQNKCG